MRQQEAGISGQRVGKGCFFQESLGVGNAFREDGLVDIHAGVFVIAIETVGREGLFLLL